MLEVKDLDVTHDGSAGTDDDMIDKKDDATNSTFLWFCLASCSETFAGSSSYPCPGGIEVMVLISGTIRLLR